MIDKALNLLNGKPIKEWKVWFITPMGFHKTLAEALESAAREDFPADLIRPSPVATTEDGDWEPGIL